MTFDEIRSKLDVVRDNLEKLALILAREEVHEALATVTVVS